MYLFLYYLLTIFFGQDFQRQQDFQGSENNGSLKKLKNILSLRTNASPNAVNFNFILFSLYLKVQTPSAT